jgi:hypothetical protein
MTDLVCFMQDRFERWILVHPRNQRLAWSGSRWVPIDEKGFPLVVQVCNFRNEQEAVEYVAKYQVGIVL